MPTFLYNAMDPTGEKTSGVVKAENISQAAASLRDQGLTIMNLTEGKEGEGEGEEGAAAAGAPMDFLTAIGRVSNNDIVLLFRQLASLSGAGVTLIDSLRILENQAESRKLRYILTHVRMEIETGHSLGEAMQKFPKTFPVYITSIIQAGELSGMMEEALDRIAIQLEEKAIFRTQLISGLLYPVIVLLAAVGVSVFLVGYVIPKMVPFLQARGGELPWNTRLLLGISSWFELHMLDLGIGAGLFFTAAILLYQVRAIKTRVDKWKLKLPVFGKVFREIPLVQFAETVSTLLESGILVIESLKAAQVTISNAAFQDGLDRVLTNILAGESLSMPIGKERGLFPPLVFSLVKVGEETGNMGGALALVGEIYKRNLQVRLKRITTMIEPLLTVFLGGMVGFIAWSVIGGMLSMYGQ